MSEPCAGTCGAGAESLQQPANEQRAGFSKNSLYARPWCSEPTPAGANGVCLKFEQRGEAGEQETSKAPSTPFGSTAQQNMSRQFGHVHAPQLEAKLCSGPQQNAAQGNVEMQEFASAVAAAAAAGAMSALQNISATHLQSASGEKHEAFMNNAHVAASDAAMRATSMLSQPFHNCTTSLNQPPDCRAGGVQQHGAMLDTGTQRRPSCLPNTPSAINGRVCQILDHPFGGNAARTRSDGSAHLPCGAHDTHRYNLQQSWVPDHGQQRAGLQGAADCLPDDADSIGVSGSCGTRVCKSEQSLIQRLQLYAWVVCSAPWSLMPLLVFCMIDQFHPALLRLSTAVIHPL